VGYCRGKSLKSSVKAAHFGAVLAAEDTIPLPSMT